MAYLLRSDGTLITVDSAFSAARLGAEYDPWGEVLSDASVPLPSGAPIAVSMLMARR